MSNLFLFANNNEGTAEDLGFYRLYQVKIEGDTVIRDFQPVLDSNNIPCLMDKINNTFYYNQGTGDFIAGRIIGDTTDAYTPINYIESNGTQYIDTGVEITDDTDIDMVCRATSETPLYIMNGLTVDTTYKYNEIDTTVEPNLTAFAGATLTLGDTNLAYLYEDEIEQAINDGWNLL